MPYIKQMRMRTMVVAERPLGRTMTSADSTATSYLRSLRSANRLNRSGPFYGPLGMQGRLFYLRTKAVDCGCYAAAVVRHAGKPKAHFNSAQRSNQHQVIEAAKVANSKYLVGEF